MLLCQQRGGHENGHLFGILRRNKGRSHGDFCFTKANVTTDQAIHHFRGAHVVTNCGDRGGLVWCLFKWECSGKSFVIIWVDTVGKALTGLSSSVDF